MKLTYIKQAGEPDGDAGDQYVGLDRFGRVVDQRWPDGSSELERVDYGFTPASNRQWRQNRVAAGGQDEYYNYDGLYQVAELNRGTLNSGKTAISGVPAFTEDFTYDPIGNWDAYLTKVSGVTDLDQTRTHNTANETTEIDGSDSTVAHDLAGNMTMVPQVADWSSTNELKWDAWNRLAEVGEGETVVAEYRYDGKFRRVSKETDATRHYFYSDRWQIIEERIDDGTDAERQFVWGQRYIDDLVLRDRDVDADGSMDERLYVLSDYFNPTAIADEDGVVVERYGYNAFGLSRVMTPAFEPRSSSNFDWETRYGAYRYDAESGFYQVRYRYLHPTLGRWFSRDPIEEQVGLNLFNYVKNSSCNTVDVYGLYALVFGRGLSDEQQCVVTGIYNDIKDRLQEWIDATRAEVNAASGRIADSCPYKTAYIQQLSEAIRILIDMQSRFSGNQQLKFEYNDISRDRFAQAEFWRFGSKEFRKRYIISIQGDKKSGKDFFELNPTTQFDTLLHEISHYSDTEDWTDEDNYKDQHYLTDGDGFASVYSAKPPRFSEAELRIARGYGCMKVNAGGVKGRCSPGGGGRFFPRPVP